MAIQIEALESSDGSFRVVLVRKGNVGRHSRVTRIRIPMNHNLMNLPVLTKIFRFSKRVFVSYGAWDTDYVHKIALHDAIVVEVFPIDIRIPRSLLANLTFNAFLLLLFLIFLLLPDHSIIIY